MHTFWALTGEFGASWHSRRTLRVLGYFRTTARWTVEPLDVHDYLIFFIKSSHDFVRFGTLLRWHWFIRALVNSLLILSHEAEWSLFRFLDTLLAWLPLSFLGFRQFQSQLASELLFDSIWVRPNRAFVLIYCLLQWVAFNLLDLLLDTLREELLRDGLLLLFKFYNETCQGGIILFSVKRKEL